MFASRVLLIERNYKEYKIGEVDGKVRSIPSLKTRHPHIPLSALGLFL
jgi:hypothetical protein